MKPSILIPKETVIGYGRSPVASCGEAIELGEGNHFLLARNGRGKTTLLRTLAGTLRPLKGNPTIQGHTQFIGDNLSFDRELPARAIFSSLLNRSARREARRFAEEAELDTRKPFGRLSLGNRQKVLLILAEFRAGMEKAAVLLLDEPFTGLDTPAREAFLGLWKERAENTVRFITTHPDQDSLDLGRPVIITDGAIRPASPEEGQSWGALKTHLN